MKNQINTYILCGGKSSRMRTEKGLVYFRGNTFMSCILNAVKPISENICLVTSNRDYEKFGLELVKDIFPEKGPLGGIYTALHHSSAEKNLILSCDIPLISTEIIERLLKITAQKYAEISYLADSENEFPLIGVYEKKLTKALEFSLQYNELRVQQFVKSRYSRKIIVDAEEANLLKNINTQQQLASLN
ncbi:molybdenum cofactor guanylyltransferase [Salegentibacter sp. 24]|uniref:molybdenum cofactor guanylyltransferase n=1 Tax=Salegentibacter sp. 24 TaxID=2183986 RepID=UPI00106173DD|nr:molybdenum cofactor guanylyltransferase [Salegentibacter sp. 24]TDN86361.1 molybdenum cofactor guanylyltransferase [Salegentibacter sp. 24]